MRSSDLLLSGNELELLSATLFVTGPDMQIIGVWRDSRCRVNVGTDGADQRPCASYPEPDLITHRNERG